VTHVKVACDDITDVHFHIHEDNTVSLFLVAPMWTDLGENPMAKIKVDNSANVYFTELDGKWRAKWMTYDHEGIWCGFSDTHQSDDSYGGLAHCKYPHDTKDDATQCAIGRYMIYHGSTTT
jgi:hypothetical protein